MESGLANAIVSARCEADPATCRVHVPDKTGVKAIRRKLDPSAY